MPPLAMPMSDGSRPSGFDQARSVASVGATDPGSILDAEAGDHDRDHEHHDHDHDHEPATAG